MFYSTVAYLAVAVVVICGYYLLGSGHGFNSQSALAEAVATAFGWPWYIWKFISASS